MKKVILSATVYLALICSSYKLVTANENSSVEKNLTAETNTEAASTANGVKNIDEYIKSVYDQIDFSKSKKLDYDVFEKAYYGYLNLRNSGKITSDKDILTVCDFSKSSTAYRLWVIDLNSKQVLINDYVAHGQGSGDEFATAFSNTSNSHQSSLGFYVTDDTYMGKHGLSLRLRGMDNGYNSAAYERAVVVHGANYVSNDFVAGQKRLGRSWGCPAVSDKIADKMINTIKGGTCLFIYAPQKEYLASSVWLNKKIDNFHTDHAAIASLQKSKGADTIITYTSDFATGRY